MNKKMLILTTMAILLVFSCQTSPFVWDNTLAEEELAEVRFENIKITSINGINVKNYTWVKIPAGPTTFTADVRIAHSGLTFAVKEAEFTCSFPAGKKYTVRGRAQDMRWGVGVFLDKEQINFVPFVEQPTFTK